MPITAAVLLGAASNTEPRGFPRRMTGGDEAMRSVKKPAAEVMLSETIGYAGNM